MDKNLAQTTQKYQKTPSKDAWHLILQSLK